MVPTALGAFLFVALLMLPARALGEEGTRDKDDPRNGILHPKVHVSSVCSCKCVRGWTMLEFLVLHHAEFLVAANEHLRFFLCGCHVKNLPVLALPTFVVACS